MKAKDLIKKLEEDPEYIKMKQKKEEEAKIRKDAIEKIEYPFIEELNKHGFGEIKNLPDLQRLKEIDDILLNLILKWILIMDNTYNSQEVLVRILKKAKNPFDGTTLIKLFDSDDASFNLKWAIADTIARSQATNVTDWVEQRLSVNRPSKECEMLIYAAMRLFSYEKARSIFLRLFKIFPLQIADAFTKIGTDDDLMFLRVNNKEFDREVQTAIGDYANKLGKRLRKR